MPIDAKLILEHSKSLCVLYVEDDQDLREKTSKVLGHFFKEVVVAADGDKGLETFQARYQDHAFDLVITDINMPRLNGIEMAQEIQKTEPCQPIIFITAHNEISYLQEAIKIGTSGFLVKPLQDEQLKDILYKTTRAISDHKLALEHEEQIIADNVEMLQNVRFLQKARTVRQIIDEIEKEKEPLTHQWVKTESVKEKLHQHDIDGEFFRTHYAIKVLEYFIGVVHGDNKVGQCPVINALLEFFKHKHLPLESIFIICVNFKNTLTSYVFEYYEFNRELFDELSLILDKNFEGVVRHYMQLNATVPESQKDSTSTPRADTAPHKESTFDYSEYVFDHDIFELKELETEIENLAISVTMGQNRDIKDYLTLGEKIKRYGTMLTAYPAFASLGNCILKLGESFTQNAQMLHRDPQTTNKISTLLEGFVSDLMLWRKELFEEHIDDPNFLNASFFSNVDTIIYYIEKKDGEGEGDEDGIEFF